MDFLKKTKLNNKKDKANSDEPPIYQTIDPTAAPKLLTSPKDSKSKPSIAKETKSVPKPMVMPPKSYDEYVKEDRQARRDKQRAEPDSEDSDSDNGKMSKQIVRRKDKQRAETDSEESDHDSRRKSKQIARRKNKQRAESDSEDSDYDHQKKSKQVARRKDKAVAKRDRRTSKKKRRDESDSDSDEEMIVTKTARKKTLDSIDEMNSGMVDLLCHVFQVYPKKVNKWCEDGLIKWDRQLNEYDVEKILDKQDDEGEVKRFRKEYAKYKDRWQKPAEEAGPSSRRGPAVVIQAVPTIGMS